MTEYAMGEHLPDVFDVAVVGGGPAGAAAALAARAAGASVALIDRAGFPRDKACGDGIAAPTVEALVDLGITGAVAGYEPIDTLRLIAPSGCAVARRLSHPAYTIPREVFDARLHEAAVAAGAVPVRHAVRALRRRGGRVELDGALAARTVIGADGAGSVIRRLLGFGPNPDGHVAIAIRGYAPALPGPAEQLIVTSSARWPAYAWAFPIGDGRANVGYGEVLQGRPTSRAHLIERLAALLPTLDHGAVTGLRAHHLPLSTRRPPPGRGPVLLAGDALSLINPFTGEGIFYAVLSGALAGRAAALARAAPDRAVDRYRRALRQRLGRHLAHSRVAAALAQHPRIVDAAITAAARDQRVFGALVALGLGDGRLDGRTLLRIAAGLRAERSTVGS
ncbi:NAD(P)/FAD-dependent oxidoreductase [Rhizomonospora bruguierae]|uniref:NAD(P)/FAD-dependent oxidoreductase n=1 Tax=Rhizomonospora bruguierae TaxID=1581705 RepID=UPI0020BDC3FE|nr:geranylgeranyl reductase family protein [Micromonospora sp. NBRC 107566]